MSCPLPSEQPVKRDEEGDKVTFHTPLGKKIFEAVTPKQRPLKNELFFPGRMYFRYELDEDFGSEIPTNVIRSKAEFSDFQVTFLSFFSFGVSFEEFEQTSLFSSSSSLYSRAKWSFLPATL